jgi:hypothetical protein
MQEYELYVPLCDNDGREIDPALLNSLKVRLRDQFGGFTYFPQEGEGEWKTGGQTFRDRIVILRVLTSEDASTRDWFCTLKSELLHQYSQSDFLITSKKVEKL